MELNERMKQLRKEYNLTTKKLSEILDVSASAISLYENGKRTPNKNLILKMADFFNVSTDFLLGKSDVPNAEILHINRKKAPYDISKELKKMLIQIERTDNIVFEETVINTEVRFYLIKCLQLMLDALCLMSYGLKDD